MVYSQNLIARLLSLIVCQPYYDGDRIDGTSISFFLRLINGLNAGSDGGREKVADPFASPS